MPLACIFVFICSRNVVKEDVYCFDNLPLKMPSRLKLLFFGVARVNKPNHIANGRFILGLGNTNDETEFAFIDLSDKKLLLHILACRFCLSVSTVIQNILCLSRRQVQLSKELFKKITRSQIFLLTPSQGLSS